MTKSPLPKFDAENWDPPSRPPTPYHCPPLGALDTRYIVCVWVKSSVQVLARKNIIALERKTQCIIALPIRVCHWIYCDMMMYETSMFLFIIYSMHDLNDIVLGYKQKVYRFRFHVSENINITNCVISNENELCSFLKME